MNNIKVKVGGWIPDKIDVRDLSFSGTKSNLVKLASNSSDHIITEYTPISNQEQLNSCVGNAVADSIEILIGASGKQVQQLSRLFVYWNSRLYTKDTDKDDGTYIRNAFDSIKVFGVCLESTWVYNSSKVFAQPPIKAYKEAYVNKIDSYYKITSSGSMRCDDIELAIRSNHPVVFGTAVTKEFTQYFGGGNKIWKNANGDIAGNHAMVITGVRHVNGSRQFLIRNSWSSYWGDTDNPGHTWFEESYLAAPYTMDIWVPTFVPDLLT
jgi:hypothetical protein